MQTTVERTSPTTVKLLIIADSSELRTAKIQAVKKLSTNLKVPGFRPGKAPEAMAEKYLDPNALSQETLETAANELYVNALVNENLRPVKNPDITIKIFVPYEQLSFEAAVEVVGEVKLGKYKGLAIKRDEVKVLAKDINEVLERMREQLATRDEVKRAAKDGDEAVIDFEGTDPKTDEKIKGADGKDYPLVLGSKTFIPGFEENVIGMEPGQTKTFDVTFPEDYGVDFLKKKKVNFKVELKQVNERKLPKLDDAFAKLVGPFNSLDELKSDIKKELVTTKENDALAKQQNEIVEAIVKSSQVDIPESLVDEEYGRIESEQRQNAAYRGMTWSEYLQSQGVTEEEFAKTAKEQAEQRIKMGLVLGAVANDEELSIGKDELDARLEQLKQQYTNDKQMQNELDKPDNQQDIKNRLLVDKTVNRLVELNS